MPRAIAAHILRLLPLLAIVAAAPLIAAEGRVALDKPLSLRVAKLDKTVLIGELAAYDRAGFEFTSRNGNLTAVQWSDLAPRDIFLLHVRLLDRNGDAARWLELGRMLRGLEGGEEYAERALTQAVRIDESLLDATNAVRAAAGPDSPPPAAAADTGNIDPVTSTLKPRAPEAPPADAAAAMPATSGAVDPLAGRVWGVLAPQEHELAVARLKEKAGTARLIAPNLRLYETEYFLFYTDLGAAEARRWQGLLDQMYNRLLEMFAIPKGVNIWHGKALVFVFANQADFHAYEAEAYGMIMPWAAGLCHSFSNGEVHISFFRQPDEAQFASVLVHESVHGFIHRYRSPRSVVSWVNEGLAEWIAFELVDTRIGNGNRAAVKQEAASELRLKPSLGGMFEKGHIDPEHYLQTLALTDVLINEVSRRGYVQFINAIKDGEAWEPAFERCFKLTVNDFLARYSEYLKLPQTLER